MSGKRLGKLHRETSKKVLNLDLNMVEEVALWQHFKDVRKDPTVGETDCYVYLFGGRDGDNCVTNTVERFSVRIDVWG